jgi:hypothetical protein
MSGKQEELGKPAKKSLADEVAEALGRRAPAAPRR